jgi:hypothetical protein
MTNTEQADETSCAVSELRIHDYTARRRYWGHDYALTPDSDPATARIAGWGGGLREGDFLLLTHPETRIIVVYQLEEVAYYGNPGDPGDQWHGRVRFVPATSELGQRVRHTAMQDTIDHIDRKWLGIQLREGVTDA